MSDRNLDDLESKARDAAKAAIAECLADGMDILVTCTYRTGAEQNALYAQGLAAGYVYQQIGQRAANCWSPHCHHGVHR